MFIQLWFYQTLFNKNQFQNLFNFLPFKENFSTNTFVSYHKGPFNNYVNKILAFFDQP